MTYAVLCEHGEVKGHWLFPNSWPTCPGGSVLPDDTLVIVKEDGEWPTRTGKAIYDLLAPQYDNERDRLYLADMMATSILDALAGCPTRERDMSDRWINVFVVVLLLMTALWVYAEFATR